MDPQKLSTLNNVLESYDISGEIKECNDCEAGHINDTYYVKMSEAGNSGDEYIVQRINHYVFKEPEKIMKNIKRITRHIQSKKDDDGCGIIHFIDNKNGKNFTRYEGTFWRICPYISNSFSYELTDNQEILQSAGYAFGRFQWFLSDFPLDKLHITIPDFHNTKKRLNDFFESVAFDPVCRVKELRDEIRFFEEYRDFASQLIDMQEKGELHSRVVHNDTKYNNILMDIETNEPLYIIDLDTIMPGLSSYDFGDAIRYAASTSLEDETDLTLVGLDTKKYEAITKGFITASKDFLTQNEINTMALGAIIITIELASRFLADYINGDKYFKTHRNGHNLDRARCQIKLAQDMMNKYNKMCETVERYA